MANLAIYRAYAEKTVAEYLETDKVSVDDDGDIPIQQGSTLVFVRVLDSPTGAMMRVFSPFLRNVDKTSELLEHLNELNGNATYVHFFWDGNAVFCTTDVLADDMQPSELINAIGAVCWHADKLDDEMAAKYGGEVWFPDAEDHETSQDHPKPEYTGQYL